MTDGKLLESRRILVVEDNYILATDICDWLDAAGADVVGPVPTVEQAVPLVQTEPLNAAVIDINLGQGPTFDIADRLSHKGVPFLFATGYDRSAIPKQFESAPRLEKPFKGEELVAAVGRLQR